ncbi:MAG: D-alanyl-D-alanine endopeptidase [Rhodocyclaceae bacterium]|nr:D-alanyl-D-alanine endopeptidase [Rhodocyclaceae bacterium]
MRSTLNNFLALLVVAGLAATTADPAAAAVAKKKTTISKKVSKPVASVVKKKTNNSPARKYGSVAADDNGAGSMGDLKSTAVTVIDQNTGNVLYEKNASAVVPIASITKLMPAMVALDAQPSLAETLTIGEADVDTVKGTHSRLSVGTQLNREEMLRLALMSSENRAASALSRHYPGGRAAFVAAMNAKAQALGLTETRFSDPTGLTPENVSSARDLAKMVDAAHQYPLIREFSTSEEYHVAIRGRPQTFRNTNALVRNDGWTIGLSKTGYISEAGKCLVMQVWLDNKPTIIVLLDSWGKLTRIGDANRIKRWVESLASNRAPLRG